MSEHGPQEAGRVCVNNVKIKPAAGDFVVADHLIVASHNGELEMHITALLGGYQWSAWVAWLLGARAEFIVQWRAPGGGAG